MKAISVKQPWAQLICLGIKPIENRTWPTKFRGRVHIHASGKPVPFNGMDNGMKFNKDQLRDVFMLCPVKDGRYPDIMSKYPNGAIIGEVDIVDCVRGHNSIWAEHVAKKIKNINGEMIETNVPVYNWVLENAVLYDKPIENVKGALSFWDYNGKEI